MRANAPQAPPVAWRKMPWTKAPFASLDFEATGLDFSKDTIISFGVVPVTAARIDVGDAVYQLVDPAGVPLEAAETARDTLGGAVQGLRRELALTPSDDRPADAVSAAVTAAAATTPSGWTGCSSCRTSTWWWTATT